MKIYLLPIRIGESMDTQFKRCFKCLCELPLEAFYKHSKMNDGRLNKCIQCTKRDVSEHRQNNLEKIRAYDKLRSSMPHRVAARKEYAKTDSFKVSHLKANSKYRADHPKRYIAKNILNAAVRDKKVTPEPCFICGEKAEAHHPDYDRPLDVVWLCDTHHKQAHALVKEYKEAA